MASHDTGAEGLLPETVLEAAAEWYVLVRDAKLDDEGRRNFRQWLEADPRHPRAYDEVRHLWDELRGSTSVSVASCETEGLASVVVSSRRSWGWMAAVLVLILVFAAWTLGEDWVYRWRGAYVTKVGERMDVTLADGSLVSLNTDTVLLADIQSDRRSIHLLRGEAWFSVVERSGVPVDVQTSEGHVEANGANFNLKLFSNSAIVSLAGGQATLRSPARQQAALSLSPGMERVMTRNGVGPEVLFYADVLSAWRRGQVIFRNTPLRLAVDELNRYRPGYVVVWGRELGNLAVTGTYESHDPDGILDKIGAMASARISRAVGGLAVLY